MTQPIDPNVLSNAYPPIDSFTAPDTHKNSQLYKNEVSSEKVFNFFFHPLDEDHSPLVKTCSVIALAFLSLLSGGIYIVVFVYVNRHDLVDLDQLSLPDRQEHYSTSQPFEVSTVSTQVASTLSALVSNPNEQDQEESSTASSLSLSPSTASAETQKPNTAKDSDHDCYTNEFSEGNLTIVQQRMERLSRSLSTRASISLDSTHREGPNCLCDRCDPDIALQSGDGFAMLDDPQHLRGSSSTQAEKPPYAQFIIHRLAPSETTPPTYPSLVSPHGTTILTLEGHLFN